jgi:hypothetical protein
MGLLALRDILIRSYVKTIRNVSNEMGYTGAQL